MDSFVGIGNNHWRESEESWNASFDYVAGVLAAEKPDVIMVEYGFREYGVFNAEWAKSIAQQIEQGRAKVKFELIEQRFPLIYLDDLCVFSEGAASKTPIEARAAITYALANGVPVFFVDEPFLRSNNFSPEVRERGIIGFQNSRAQNYVVLLTDYENPRTGTQGLRLMERNLFITSAAETLDVKFKPKTLASVGGLLHYYLTKENVRDLGFFDPNYNDQFTLPALLKVKDTRVYNALEMKLVKPQPPVK